MLEKILYNRDFHVILFLSQQQSKHYLLISSTIKSLSEEPTQVKVSFMPHN